MAAFNWVEFEDICPNCAKKATIRAQTHIAADFDGDASGRFCERVYKVGDQMAWFKESDSRFPNWSIDDSRKDQKSGASSVECCYAGCRLCAARLFAIIEFKDLKVLKIAKVGLEEDWPGDHFM